LQVVVVVQPQLTEQVVQAALVEEAAVVPTTPLLRLQELQTPVVVAVVEATSPTTMLGKAGLVVLVLL